MSKNSEKSNDNVSRRQRIVMLLPVFVLIAIALNEPRLYLQENLTSWKGGGFGMFATIDKHPWRPVVVKITFTDRNGENEKVIQVDIRSYLNAIDNDADKMQHFEDTQSLPNQHNLGVLASQMAEFKYITDEGPFAIVNTRGFGSPITARQITIEIHRLVYDDATNRGTYELLTTWNSR